MDTPTRARASTVALTDAWAAKGRADLRQTRDDLTLVITEAPGEIFSARSALAGIDFRVQLLLGTEEIPVDGHRRFIRPPIYVYDPERQVGRRLDPVAAAWNMLWDSVLETPAQENWGDPRGTVTTVFAGTADGRIDSSNATYSVARSGSGSLSANTTSDLIVGQALIGGVRYCRQGFVSFDTGSVPDTDDVSAVDLSLWLTTDTSTTDFTTEAREYDWGASVTTADFRPGADLAALTLMASIASSGIGATGAYKAFTSETAFLTATNLKTGTVYLNLSSSRQRLDNDPAGDEYLTWESADTAGTTNDPKLTITHAAASVTATPGVLAMTTATFAPTVSVTDHKTLTPGVLSLLSSLFAPVASVSNNQSATPDLVALTTATFAPTVAVSDNQVATPGVLTLVTASFAPSASLSDNQLVTPGVLALITALFAPDVAVTAHVTATPDVLATVLSAFAPVVTATDPKLVTPDVLTMVTAAFAPSILTPVVVMPDVLALATTGFAPTVTAISGVTATPETLSLVTVTFAPVIATTDNQLVTVSTASLLTVLFAPAVLTPVVTTPDVLSLVTSTFAPTVTAPNNQLVTPDALSLATTPFAPLVSLSAHQLVTPGVLALLIALYAPTVTGDVYGSAARPGTGHFYAPRSAGGRFFRNQPGVGR